MVDRGFNETDLRTMLDNASGLDPDVTEDRWLVRTRLGSTAWEVVVEPDWSDRVVVVITAYPVDQLR